MSLGAGHAPLIILSNSIYAKRRDGSFYPGSIESKQEDCYTVKFADGAKERVHEENLTWLGFWGLPPWYWPKSPVIQPVVSSWEAFESQTMFDRDTVSNVRNAASVNELRRDHTMRFHGAEETTATNPDMLDESLNKNEKLPSHLLPEQADVNQPRSSVLRINSNALTKDGSLDVFRSLRDFAKEDSSNATIRSNSPSTQSIYKEKQGSMETVCLTSTNEPMYSRSSTSADGFYRNKEHELSSEKAMYRYFLERRRSASERGIGRSTEDEDIRMVDRDADYFTKELPKSPYSPTLSPTRFFSSPLPLFGQPFGMTMIGASPHTVIPTSFRLQMKARRKDEKKKCRKVYGIENRHFWCTQCKWKKACTRFTTGSKIISNGFV